MSASSHASSPYPSSRATSEFPPTTAASPEDSTAPSSPLPGFLDLDDEDANAEADEEEIDEEKWQKLEPFLERVTVYAKVLKEQMDSAKYTRPAPAAAPRSTRKRPRESASDSRSTKQMRKDAQKDVATSRDEDENKAEEPRPRFTQPLLVTGGKLKDYQLEGVAWMAGLYQNGISGILADEMGLGKTIQTIAFNAFLRERTAAPFLIVCPLSVLTNWASEFHKFAPEVSTSYRPLALQCLIP
ncbi:hypothetical protein NM688_g7068 [Phlebia brevispora]|uniref:Uncharacterized protein n=1 Tax=Phlebia brevispora TaxID=194682 RepID=A0ACC1S9C4_9APHY|nr:hypothetical protein NM688_g7068 [Phlebia brevispora]